MIRRDDHSDRCMHVCVCEFLSPHQQCHDTSLTHVMILIILLGFVAVMELCSYVLWYVDVCAYVEAMCSPSSPPIFSLPLTKHLPATHNNNNNNNDGGAFFLAPLYTSTAPAHCQLCVAHSSNDLYIHMCVFSSPSSCFLIIICRLSPEHESERTHGDDEEETFVKETERKKKKRNYFFVLV